MQILKSLEDLNQWETVESDLLSTHPSYQQWLAKSKEKYERIVESYSMDYRPYQYEYAALYALRPYNILGLQMGCGKTNITLLTINAVYEFNLPYRKAGTVHIIVPDALAASRWVEDIARFEELKDNYELIGNTKELHQASKPILIYDYDLLRSKMPKPRRNHPPELRSTNEGRKLAADYIYQYLRPNCLVVDEAHNLCDRKSLRHRLISKLRRRAKRCLMLSGTVSDGSLDGVYALCKLTYGNLFPYSDAKVFKSVFGESQRLRSNYLTGTATDHTQKWLEVLSSSKLREYYELSRRFIHRVKLTDPQVYKFVTLPTEQPYDHRVIPTHELVTQYKNLVISHKQEMIAVANASGVRANAAALRLIHPLLELVNSTNSPKYERLLEIINSSEGKVVIFCSRIASAEDLTQSLTKDLKTTPVYLHSSLSDAARVALVLSFQKDPNVRVGVFSIHLSATAIDLTSASCVIFYDHDWSSRKVQQAAARVRRPGNRHQVVKIHYLSHRGLVDEHQVELYLQKRRGSQLANDFEVVEDSSSSAYDAIETDLSAISVLRGVLSNLD